MLTLKDLQVLVRQIKSEYRDKIQELRVQENRTVNELLNNNIELIFPISSSIKEAYVPDWKAKTYVITSYDDMYVYLSIDDRIIKERKDEMIFKFIPSDSNESE